MVVIKQLKPVDRTFVNNELRLNSMRCIRYVAPLNVDISSGSSDAEQYVVRKRSDSDQTNDLWEGARDFCQALDDIIVIEKDTELFVGKSVLEIGFTTGLPSMLAFGSGAHDVTLHSFGQHPENVKLTIQRKIPRNLHKFTTGNLETCLRSLGGKKYDVILAPELINADETDFDALIDVLNAALAPNGLILLCGRTFYPHCSGSLQGFTDLIKSRGLFDVFIRWESTKTDLAPRKLVQMTRTFR